MGGCRCRLAIKAVKHAYQSSFAQAEQPGGDAYVPRRLRKLAGAWIGYIDLSTTEGAADPCSPSREDFRREDA